MTRLYANNQMVVGVTANAGATLNSLAFICQTTTSIAAGALAPTTTLAAVGGNAATVRNITRRCPPGMAVRAVVGRADTVVDQLRLVCESISTPPSEIPVNAAPVSGGVGVGVDARFSREHCSDRGIAFGLYGRLGTDIERLGTQCLGTARVGGLLGMRGNAINHMTPAEGRELDSNSTDFDLQCPLGMALTAVVSGTRPGSGAISFVRGICSDIDQWDRPNVVLVQTMATATIGTDFGNGVTSSCPADHFVAGLEARSMKITATSLRSIERIVPICRRIGG